MRVKVLFFGQLKDVAGRAEDSVELPENAQIETVFEHFAAQFPRIRDLGRSIVLARNCQFAPPGTALSEGDEVAFLPPVSGGSRPFISERTEDGGNFYALTRDPIDVEALKRRIVSPADGAAVTFDGVVRNNTKGRATRFLDYEGYEPMALETMAQIGRELASTYQIGRIGMVHRLGRMEIGETSVAIVVAAPHRRPAFEAALEAINRLKKTVPIWKKEYFEDGELWVEGAWDSSVVQR